MSGPAAQFRRVLLVLLGCAALAPAAQAAERYVVVYEQGVERPGLRTDRLQRAEDFRARLRYGHAVKGFAAALTDLQVRALRADPAVALVAPDRRVHATASVPLARGERAPTGVRRMGGATTTTARQASSVNVAVLDTGIDFAQDVAAVHGKNCVGTGTAADDNGHGTHVAGTIGARNGGSGVVGVAPGTRQYAVKVLGADGGGDWSRVICGIDWVASTRTDADPANDVAVANLSLSGSGPAVGSCTATTDPLHLAICRATKAGVTFVVAAGNSGWDFDHPTTPDVPAAYPEVLTVTALADGDGTGGAAGPAPACEAGQADDRAATFSNFAATAAGRAHTVAAPGSCIESTARGSGLSTMSGTSMAAPHVTGAVALCFGEAGNRGPCSGLTPAQVVAKVRADADAASRASAALRFAGDPLTSPVTGRYYGFTAPAPAPAAGDTTSPTTTGATPAAAATALATTSTVSVTFSEPMDKAAAQAAFSVVRAADRAAVAGAYSWSGTTLTFRPSTALGAGTTYAARVTVAARDLAGNALAGERSWSFATAGGATFAPVAVSLLTGTLAAGTAAALAAQDGVTYQVRSTAAGTRQATWAGRVGGISKALRSLRVTYVGSSSAACAQTVAAYNWVTGAWVALDTRTAGTSPATVDRTVAGTLAEFVSATGDVAVRVTCTSTAASFTTSGDLLRVTTTA